MFDLSAYDYKAFAEKGVEVQLLDPESGSKLDVFIGIKGEDSSDWQEAISNAKSLSNGESKTHDDKVSDMAFALASVTTHWRGLVVEGKEIEFSRDAAMAIYAQYQWVADQVYISIRDRDLFLASASKH